ncbi:MAG: hypothetical protein QFF03_08180 [Pseudomonadota bacterium]|nr:hypothetical protein [Pseudomonadota bacterium]
MIECSSNANRPAAALAHADFAATDSGLAAAEQAMFAGLSVNLTLLCSPRQLGAARAAHRRALARRLAAHLPVQAIVCTASMPLGWIDRAVDALLPPSATALRGQAAIAAARIARADSGDDQAFAVFAAFGAAPLQLRWSDASAAHTGALAQPDAADHATDAHALLVQLAHHGIDLDTIGNDLLCAALTQCGHADAQLLALPA